MSEVSNSFVQPLESRTLLSVSAHSGHHVRTMVTDAIRRIGT